MRGNGTGTTFPGLLQSFFCDRLIAQKNASGRTVATYRDAFRLLLAYAAGRTGKTPSALTLEDLGAPTILGFLDHLETERGNSIRTRNARLAAIRSFMRYASYHAPEALPTIQRVLAIPTKRFDRPLLGFLSREEMEAVLSAPDRSVWSGHRDAVMFSVFYNTGARVSEVIRLRVEDLAPGRNAYVRILGKGRKQRTVPLWRSTTAQLRGWTRRIDPAPSTPRFPNRSGAALSRSGVERRLQKAVSRAVESCPSLKDRRISPHTIRHTTAMHLLQSGVDITVIALWLGHESPTTTHTYVEADLAMKERAIATLQEPPHVVSRYVPDDDLLAFLQAL